MELFINSKPFMAAIHTIIRRAIKLKFEKNNTNIDQMGFDKAIEQFKCLDIMPDIDKIIPFLNKNNISYDKKELNKFINDFMMATDDKFSIANLQKILGSQYQEIKSTLIYDKLNQLEVSNKSIKKSKI